MGFVLSIKNYNKYFTSNILYISICYMHSVIFLHLSSSHKCVKLRSIVTVMVTVKCVV